MISPTLYQFKGLIDPTNKFLYIDISKNASTKIKDTLYKEGWTIPLGINYEEKDSFLKDKRIFCVLREPYQRYLSGFVEYIGGEKSSQYDEVVAYSAKKFISKNFKSNFDILRLIFFSAKFNFDNHTELQSDNLMHFDIGKIDFFYLNDQLGTQITKYFHNHKIFISFTNDKVHARPDKNSWFYKSLIQSFFEKDEHIMFKENLLNYLKPDYELINSINFYHD